MNADKLHPVAIGVLSKSNVLHTTIGELLLEWVAGIFNSLASGLDVVDGDSDMSEATVRLSVAIDNVVVRVSLSTIVVSKFKDTVTVSPVTITLEGSRTVIGEEIERELVFGEVQLLDLIQAKEFIELH